MNIEDFASVYSGGTPSTKKANYWNGDICWITPKDLSNHNSRFIKRGERNISDEGLSNSSAILLPKDAIIISSRAPIGYIAIASNPFATNQGCKTLVCDKDLVNPIYIYYLIKANVRLLESLSTGSTFSEISASTLKKISFQIPNLEEQNYITHILGTLDEKIELNRQMNKTLEGMARAIFKSWFIDFDPVYAKAEGRKPFGMDEETAALFPDEFEDSELGMIPKGWSYKSITNCAIIKYGAPFSSKMFNDKKIGYPLIRIRDLESYKPAIFTEERLPKDTIVKSGDIIVGMDGKFSVTIWYGENSLLNQRVCLFEPLENVSSAFLRFSIERPIMFFEKTNVGTTIIHLSKSNIETIRILIPDNEVMTKYQILTDDINKSLIINHKENQLLTEIRDLLIPKLISGELRIDSRDWGTVMSKKEEKE